MFNKMAIPALSLALGLLIGGGTVEYGHRRSDFKSKQKFEQRIRCKSLADGYVRKESNKTEGVLLSEVGYSAIHNSCFAAVTTYRDPFQGWELVDLLSGKTTQIGTCNVQRNCGNGNDMKYSADLDIAFKRAIEGTESLPMGGSKQ
jgi:hypothetical protein